MTRRVNNDRGLGRYGETDVVDSYGQTIRVQDSSACADDGPCVWIFCNDEDGRDFVEHPPAPRGIVVRSPHLTAKQAVGVANRLLEFVELADPEALACVVVPGRPDFHETCRNYEDALDHGVSETIKIADENQQLRADLANAEAENKLLREALPTSDEWLDSELALSAYEETTQTGRKPPWDWALRVRSVLARLDAARKETP